MLPGQELFIAPLLLVKATLLWSHGQLRSAGLESAGEVYWGGPFLRACFF